MSAPQSVQLQSAQLREPFISKSKYLWGLQCPKLLWHAYNAKHLLPPADAQQQAIFDQGQQVGGLAKRLFPDGFEVGEGVTDLDESIRLTRQALTLRRPLFEAAFAAEGGYARADILVPVGSDAWKLIEVKSTTSVKAIHLRDLAFQTYVLSQASLELRGCSVLHLNAAYVRHGQLDPRELFVNTETTAQVLNLCRGVEEELSTMSRTIRRRACPEVQIGPQCDEPYPCPLRDHCWEFLPEQNVMDLYRGAKKGLKLLAEGVTDLRDIPAGVKLTARQQIQRQAAATTQPHVEARALTRFLGQLKYPLHFLDFETFATALPLFDGLRPFEQVPFQFSLHVVRVPGAAPEPFGFLADGASDPRPEFMRRLTECLGAEGSIVAFNAEFEQGRLRECVRALPRYASWLAGVEPRFVDLLRPFRDFHYYHPRQRGSGSMKSVLPALTGRGYEHLAIQEGNTASLEFLRVTFTDAPADERERVRRQLEAYCALDTEGMIWIVEALRALVANP
ncbi:MAG: DUF2779 domain-containing protein [Verrucomicrobia bacterium]|nr:DUF2779 domain-containing protein [Verrucomicrobiota bacterium]